MAKKQRALKAAVSERALIQRVNRKLKNRGEELRAARNDQQADELGNYFTVSLSAGVLQTHVKLEKLAREIGVLRPWEALAGVKKGSALKQNPEPPAE